MGWIRVDCKSHKSFIYNGPPDLYKPERPRLAQGPRPPPSKQPAAVSNARGRGGCRVSLGPGAGCRERGQRVGAGPASPSPRAAALHDPGPDPPPAGSRRARSRVAAAADGHRPIVHLQADGTAELCFQAAVAARGPGWRLPLLCRGHQAAEHRHPPARPPPPPPPLSPIQAGRPASLPRRRRTGVTARPAPVLRHDCVGCAPTSSWRAGSSLLRTSPPSPCVRPVRTTRCRLSGRLCPCHGRGKSRLYRARDCPRTLRVAATRDGVGSWN